MCVTTAFDERDPAPWQRYEGRQPSLAAALRATHGAISGQTGPAPYDKLTSWCSNPNIEVQQNNGKTNCIGCHQYSMAWNPGANRFTRFSDTLNADSSFPQFGRSRRRANFPGEFSWSFDNEGVPAKITASRAKYGYVW